jgi:hypothetical protein
MVVAHGGLGGCICDISCRIHRYREILRQGADLSSWTSCQPRRVDIVCNHHVPVSCAVWCKSRRYSHVRLRALLMLWLTAALRHPHIFPSRRPRIDFIFRYPNRPSRHWQRCRHNPQWSTDHSIQEIQGDNGGRQFHRVHWISDHLPAMARKHDVV